VWVQWCGRRWGRSHHGWSGNTKVEKLKYLGSILEERRDIDDDINHRIRVGWQKRKNESGVLCDKKIPVRLKEKVYRMVVRPALLLWCRVLANQED